MRPPLRVVFAALAVLLAAGCSGGGDDAPPAETPAPTTADAPTGHGSFAQCLAEHGVPAPPGPVAGAPPGVDEQTWQQAMADCSTLAPGPAD